MTKIDDHQLAAVVGGGISIRDAIAAGLAAYAAYKRWTSPGTQG